MTSRRQFLTSLGGMLALAGVSAACRAATPSSAPAASATTPVAPAQVTRGGTLTVAAARPIATTLPYPGNQFFFSWGGPYEPLVSVDANSQPVARLAESWTASDDLRVLRFSLRKGVTFHSGRQLTADDIRWNVEFVKDPKNGAAAGAELKAVEVGVLDPSTVELRLSDAMPHIFSLLAGVLIFDPESDVASHGVGTGPFRVDAFSAGDELRLVRNEHYWRPDRPLLDGITFKTLTDPNATAVALETGAVSMAPLAIVDAKRLSGNGSVSVVVLPDSGSYDFVLNASEPPLSDKRVRQAIDLALDRKRFAGTVLYGLTEPTHIIWIRLSPAWDATIDVGEFNLDKARQLLVDAGYPNGFETRILGNSSLPEMLQFDQIVQADLEKIGVRVTIDQLDVNEATSLITQAKFPAIANHSYAYGDQDPAMQFTAFVLRPEGNASRFHSDEYVREVQAARREPDWDKRMALYRNVARLVKDEAFLLPVANRVNPWGIHSNVQGVTRQPLLGAPLLEELGLG